MPMTRRSFLEMTGAAGLAGLVGVAGAGQAFADVPNPSKIELMQAWTRVLNASNVGYDKSQRWSFLDFSKRTIVDNKECDCSSSCAAIAWLAGYPIAKTEQDLHDIYSGNFASIFKKHGFTVTAFDSLAKIKPGDFLVTPDKHVVFAFSTKAWWSAEQDERGGERGGKAGDQTGVECRFRAPYVRKGGWTSVVRPNS